MAEVVFALIALRFEGSGVFLLDFPAGAARLHEGRNGLRGEGRLRQAGRVVELGSRRIRARAFTPLARERIGAGA
jgi:hypothetical protein